MYYYDGSSEITWQNVNNQSPTGFDSLVYGQVISITFDNVETTKLRFEIFAHPDTINTSVVGLSEIAIYEGPSTFFFALQKNTALLDF